MPRLQLLPLPQAPVRPLQLQQRLAVLRLLLPRQEHPPRPSLLLQQEGAPPVPSRLKPPQVRASDLIRNLSSSAR